MFKFSGAYLFIKFINLNLSCAVFDHPYGKTTHTTKTRDQTINTRIQKKKKLLTHRASEVLKFQKKKIKKSKDGAIYGLQYLFPPYDHYHMKS